MHSEFCCVFMDLELVFGIITMPSMFLETPFVLSELHIFKNEGEVVAIWFLFLLRPLFSNPACNYYK